MIRYAANYDDESVYIIDKNDLVHMAHIDIHYGFSVNGVACSPHRDSERTMS